MSISNRDIIQSLFNLYKDGNLNIAVFEMALKSPTNLVDLFNPQHSAKKFIKIVIKSFRDNHYNDVNVYIAKNWINKIQILWNSDKKIEAIKLVRAVGSYNEKILPFDANVNCVADIKTSIGYMGLADAKILTEKICGTKFVA